MKRRTGLKSKCQTFPSQEERSKRHKRRASSFALTPAEDWGNLPHHVVLQIFQHLSLVDRARASSVCRCWNDVFHTPDLWRRFEFELNQPATSYLRSTHPDLIQQIIKRHAQHLQYVSFKVSHVLSPPPPFSQHSCLKRQHVPYFYAICCRTVHDTSDVLALVGLTHGGWDYSDTSIFPFLNFVFFIYIFLNLNVESLLVNQVDSCTESAEAACDILSQLVNCTIKTLGLISTARPSFMDVSQVRDCLCFTCTTLHLHCYPICCTQSHNHTHKFSHVLHHS